MKNLQIKTYDYSGQGIEIVEAFLGRPHVFFLDSSLTHNCLGRYSFIGFEPFDVFISKNRNPFLELRKKYQQCAGIPSSLSTPFPAGMAGYFAYDAGFFLENIPRGLPDDLNIPDCCFGFYDTVITIDRFKKKLYVSSCADKAHQKFADIEDVLHRTVSCRGEDILKPHGVLQNLTHVLKSSFSKQEYLKSIRKALEYIRQGEIYQVNFSQRFACDLPKRMSVRDAFLIYKILRNLSPAFFSAFFDGGDFQIISSSPERFLKCDGRHVQTRPMKGTRPRGATPREDEKFKEELTRSAKDTAELLMITDLERNDLGRVCRAGSIEVSALRTLEEYTTVFQTTSTIDGILKDDKDIFDLVAACFPGGSITGCPKIRAMQIIEELESVRRGIYTGALGYMSFSGQADLNILIRTLLVLKEKIFFHTGGGIVADSNPEDEYAETLTKAKAMAQALEEFLKPHEEAISL